MIVSNLEAGVTDCTSITIQHVSVVVDRLEASAEFYRAAFGFMPSFGPVDVGQALGRMVSVAGIDARLIQLSRGNGGLAIELIEASGTAASGAGPVPQAHIAFTVPNLDDALDAAREHGATLLGEIVDFEEGRSAYLKEPGGSVIELEEMHG